MGEWADRIDGAYVLVNIAGRSVICHYHQKNREFILKSRTESTEVLGEAILQCQHSPKT